MITLEPQTFAVSLLIVGLVGVLLGLWLDRKMQEPAEVNHLYLGQEVVDLVIAARELAFSEHRPIGSPETQADVEMIDLFDNLDMASAKFAEIIPWNDQPADPGDL